MIRMAVILIRIEFEIYYELLKVSYVRQIRRGDRTYIGQGPKAVVEVQAVPDHKLRRALSSKPNDHV